MKKTMSIAIMLIVLMSMLTSCGQVVEPNYIGVLMEGYGKQGKASFSIVKGRVFAALLPGAELYRVPTWEQRADFSDKNGGVLHLKAADNTEFTNKPLYSYRVIPERAIDIVFDNKQLDNGGNFMTTLENNVLETKIYDLMKKESRRYTTDELMANGGSLRFEEKIQEIVSKEFAARGLQLMSFSSQLDFSNKVKAKIDSRNEVNTNISVIDQQIIEQKKRNELAELEAQENIIRSKGLTPQIIQMEYIKMLKEIKQPIYGTTPVTLMRNN